MDIAKAELRRSGSSSWSDLV